MLQFIKKCGLDLEKKGCPICVMKLHASPHPPALLEINRSSESFIISMIFLPDSKPSKSTSRGGLQSSNTFITLHLYSTFIFIFYIYIYISFIFNFYAMHSLNHKNIELNGIQEFPPNPE